MIWLVFQTLAKIETDKIALIRMAAVETQPDIFDDFPGTDKLIIKASKGNNTAVSVIWMVRVSMDCKLFSKLFLCCYDSRYISTTTSFLSI